MNTGPAPEPLDPLGERAFEMGDSVAPELLDNGVVDGVRPAAACRDRPGSGDDPPPAGTAAPSKPSGPPSPP